MIDTSVIFTISISSYIFFLFLLCIKTIYEIFIHDCPNDIVNIKFKNIYNYFNTIAYTNCIICYETFKYNSNIIILPCKHYYHSNCLYNWITTSQSYNCPYCQKQYYHPLHNYNCLFLNWIII